MPGFERARAYPNQRQLAFDDIAPAAHRHWPHPGARARRARGKDVRPARGSRGAVAVGKVYLVGAGPGDPGLLTLRAAELIRRADVLIYDHLASLPVVGLASARCERIYAGKEPHRHALTQVAINQLLIEKARDNPVIVRLKGGDPFVFGRGGEEAEALAAASIAFEVVPGISSAIAAPAYAGIPLTHRTYNASFTVVTGHEDPKKKSSNIDWSRLADAHSTLVIMMGLGNLETIVDELRRGGANDRTPVAVIHDGTLPSQRTITGTLKSIVGDVRKAGIVSPAVVVVGDVVKLRDKIAWFERFPLFGKRILITRPHELSERFANDLYERGAQPIFAPMIEIGPPNDVAAAEAAVNFVTDYEWLVFTSQNGVRRFFETLQGFKRDARSIANVKIAAIGPQTAETLAHFGVNADLVPERFISEEIARELIATTKPQDRILLYRAQETRDVLADSLQKAGRTVRNVAGYKTTIRIDPELPARVKEADIITFTSASTVSGFLQNLKAAAGKSTAGKTIACIGPITAEAARSAGLHVDVIAQEYTVTGLLTALEGALQSTASRSRR
ncbi:MAG: uroporphyrinogen-III C-methyltransferase [Candidatus Eremiobacteraeota bacterium]|nr:uroporphyrinogen-III C-methyltransferase [Candidatus Eremiobacteraeota bacterium]